MHKDYVWIRAKCPDYFRLIKKIEVMNITAYEIKYENKYIYLKVSSNDYKKINKYLISYKFKIVKNTGFNLLLDTLKKERIWLIAIIMGLSLFFLLKNLIIEINIIHENKAIRELVKEELDDYNIKILRFKKSYKELNKIRNEILDKYPDKLDWMEFELNGMVLNVRIEERIITDITNKEKFCDLVATKEGIVNEIVVYDGEAAVSINDYVRTGDVLIKGTILYNEEEKRKTCAKGEVYATTWYTGRASIPLTYEKYEETNKSSYNLVWEQNGNKKKILRSKYERFNTDYKTILRIFDFRLYLAKEKELKKITGTYTEEEALNEGINRIVDNVQKKLSDKDEIIEKKVLKKVVNNSTMDMEVFVVVNELISTEKEIEE